MVAWRQAVVSGEQKAASRCQFRSDKLAGEPGSVDPLTPKGDGGEPKGQSSGESGCKALCRVCRRGVTPRPYIHNHVIELKGNGRASGRCYVEVRNAADNMNLLGTGYYNDEYVKVGDEWRFQSRLINLIDLQGLGKR